MQPKFLQTLCTTAALTMSLTVAASAATDITKLDQRIEAAARRRLPRGGNGILRAANPSSVCDVSSRRSQVTS